MESKQPGYTKVFDDYYEKHFRKYCYWSTKITRNKEASIDIVNDAFVHFHNKNEDFSNADEIGKKLYVRIYCRSVDQLRGQLRSFSRLAQWVRAHNYFAGNLLSSDTEIVRAEALALLKAAMDKLPPRYREVVDIHFIEELSIKETAQRMGIHTNSVRTMAGKAKDHLNKLLGPDSPLLLIVAWWILQL